MALYLYFRYQKSDPIYYAEDRTIFHLPIVVLKWEFYTVEDSAEPAARGGPVTYASATLHSAPD
jgi:hypothetical protein